MMEFHNRRTQSGFEYGSAAVDAVTSNHKTGETWIRVKTPKAEIMIRATKTGCLSVGVSSGKVKQL